MLVRRESTPQDVSSLHSDTRSKSGVLTPDTGGSGGSSEGYSNARKRKRDEVPGDNGVEELLSESFSVKVQSFLSHPGCLADNLYSRIPQLHMINPTH